jgi:hypothetical protein
MEADPVVPFSSGDGRLRHHIASATVLSTKFIDNMMFQLAAISVKLPWRSMIQLIMRVD